MPLNKSKTPGNPAFLDAFYLSLWDLDFYRSLSNISVQRTFGFVFGLVLFTALFQGIVIKFDFAAWLDSTKEFVFYNTESIVLKDGILTVTPPDRRIYISEQGMALIVDTQTDDLGQLFPYPGGALFTSDTVYYKTEDGTDLTKYEELSFILDELDLNPDTWPYYVSKVSNNVMFIMFLGFFLGKSISYLFWITLGGLVAYSAIQAKGATYAQGWILAAHLLWPFVLVQTILYPFRSPLPFMLIVLILVLAYFVGCYFVGKLSSVSEAKTSRRRLIND